MGTSAPAIKEHDIPIVEKPKKPLALPSPDPDRIITPGLPVPERTPERVERDV